MKKQLLLLFAALLPLLASAKVEINGIWYNLNAEAKTAEVTWSDKAEYSGNIIIPATVTYDGVEYDVKGIGRHAFSRCYSLTTIDIPKSVTSIGEEAFVDCSNLIFIAIPKSVTSIGERAFRGCISLTSINIPEGITSIKREVFAYCRSLTSITIPASVTSIGYSAFDYCINLTNIVVAEANRVYDSRNECNAIIETSSNTLIQGCSTTIIPEGVTSIGGDYDAFRYCFSLTSITIPESVTSIEDRAFSGCSSLTAITCKATTPPAIESSWAFNGVDKSIPVYVPAESVETYQNSSYWREFTNIRPIGSNDFEEDSSVEDFTEWTSDNQGQSNSNSSNTYTFSASQDDVLSFDWQVSSENGYDWFIATLNGVEILKESGEASGSYQYTFTSPGNYTIEVKYTKDGSVNGGEDYAKVYNIALPNSSVNNIIVSGTCGDNLTWGLTNEYELIIKGTGAMYDYEQCGTPWYEYHYVIYNAILSEGVTRIGAHAFDDCFGLNSIHIPESVTSIGVHAFSHCSSLTNITIPASVASIEFCAFYNCISFTSIIIPENVTNIGYGILMGCNGLVSVVVEEGNPVYDSRNNCNAIIETNSNTLIGGCNTTVLPNSVTSIGNRAFGSLDFISLTIPEGITSIGDYAFGGCKKLTSITIPEDASIGEGIFYECRSLTAINIPKGVTEIGYNTFYYCRSLTSITIPESVTSIGSMAFYSCSRLTAINIPEGMLSIGYAAFSDCSSIACITCKATTPPAIESSGTFDGVDKSIPVYVPVGSVGVYQSAEYWSEFSNIVALYSGKCATPTISYVDGKVLLTCDTEGAKVITDVVAEDAQRYEDLEFTLRATYTLTAYATKENYEDSDAVSLTICWVPCTEEHESEETGILTIPSKPVLISARDGVLTLSGLAEGTEVALYTTDGIMVAQQQSSAGEAQFTVSTNQIYLVHIGDKVVKIGM